uniref:Uncharacterized protein n=1 Tax=Oryza sativa subsp. japonica TaxID=39947 RepID=Q7Y1L3_ORYSJ|nr:hypothetical protein [Oryza sativa Japonica Group]AAR01710.1 hypothetical protein [Oryza sativa Japonica Group]
MEDEVVGGAGSITNRIGGGGSHGVKLEWRRPTAAIGRASDRALGGGNNRNSSLSCQQGSSWAQAAERRPGERRRWGKQRHGQCPARELLPAAGGRRRREEERAARDRAARWQAKRPRAGRCCGSGRGAGGGARRHGGGHGGLGAPAYSRAASSLSPRARCQPPPHILPLRACLPLAGGMGASELSVASAAMAARPPPTRSSTLSRHRYAYYPPPLSILVSGVCEGAVTGFMSSGGGVVSFIFTVVELSPSAAAIAAPVPATATPTSLLLAGRRASAARHGLRPPPLRPSPPTAGERGSGEEGEGTGGRGEREGTHHRRLAFSSTRAFTQSSFEAHAQMGQQARRSSALALLVLEIVLTTPPQVHNAPTPISQMPISQ